MKKIIDHFRNVDPILAKLIVSDTLIGPSKSDNYFVSLVSSVIEQQLSLKAAATIWNRFVALFPDGIVEPSAIVMLSADQIRAAGTSWSKVEYVKNIARACMDGSLDLDKIHELSDEEVITQLTQIKGIGRWTAEMFLMFSLGRDDVFSEGDTGLQNAIKKVYGLKKNPTKKELSTLTEKWKPYRTYACRLLWNSLDSPDK